MNKTLGIAILIVGVILLFFGIQSMGSFSSDVSEIFSGAPTTRSIILLSLGIIGTVVGLVGIIRGR